MEYVKKVEHQIAEWLKDLPHLPAGGQKWIAENLWWMVLAYVIISGIGLLIAIGGLILFSTAGSILAPVVTGPAILTAFIGILFSIATLVVAALAIKPLKDVQKKGWVLLFLALLIYAVSIVVNGILSFSVLGFFLSIIFGFVGLAVAGYFLFEARGYFAHPAKSTAK
ncbi:MAG: hypothetical protein JWN33_317 [Candidatus Saccharibacteria bacterium]|nr:hypothetical protein [Candidatus Saccharibacteria bacterium]